MNLRCPHTLDVCRKLKRSELTRKCASLSLLGTPRRAGRNQTVFFRKEVIQPQVPLRLPCYDFTPVTNHSLGGAFPKVKLPTSGAVDSHGVTGGVYKARERIHRGMLIRDY